MNLDAGAFLLLGVACTVGWLGMPTAKEETTKVFQQFRFDFLLGYGLCVLADWFISPYGPWLFRDYGFTQEAQGAMFFISYVISLALIFQVGALADCYGRKKVCLMYCAISFVISCLAHIRFFWVMTLGILLSDICQTILVTCFECWMVSEHVVQRSFSGGLLSYMFGMKVLLHNVSGMVAGVFVPALASLQMRPVIGQIHVGSVLGSYEASMPILGITALVLVSRWGENRGSCEDATGHLSFLRAAFRLLRSDTRVALLGAVVMCFHTSRGILFTLCFQGERYAGKGLHLPVFGMAGFCGTVVSNMLTTKLPGTFQTSITLLAGCFVTAILSSCIAGVSEANNLEGVSFCAFCLFVFSHGAFMPIAGMLKGEIVPEGLRATLYNLFEFAALLLSHSQANSSAPKALCNAIVVLLAGLACVFALRRHPPPSGSEDAFYQRVSKEV